MYRYGYEKMIEIENRNGKEWQRGEIVEAINAINLKMIKIITMTVIGAIPSDLLWFWYNIS